MDDFRLIEEAVELSPGSVLGALRSVDGTCDAGRPGVVGGDATGETMDCDPDNFLCDCDGPGAMDLSCCSSFGLRSLLIPLPLLELSCCEDVIVAAVCVCVRKSHTRATRRMLRSVHREHGPVLRFASLPT